MSALITILIFAGGVILGAIVIYLLTRKSESFLMLQQELEHVSRQLDERLGESGKIMQHQHSESVRIIKEIAQELTRVGEGQKQVVDIAKQLENLQDILKNPKQRGVLGEYYLKTVLENVLPPGAFQIQYKFPDGDIADAVIFLDKKILAVDSKFSLENYNRILETHDKTERERLEKVFKQDLKNRIDETSKYIRPADGTMDFAFMFIPSEAIYYDLLINKIGAVQVSTRDLIEYAFRDKKVIIVSPTSFLAYLQTVMQGLRSLKIEEQATEIIKRVGELGKHLENYEAFMQKLGISLGTTVGHYNTAHKELKKIDKDVVRIADKAIGVEPLMLDKPSIDD